MTATDFRATLTRLGLTQTGFAREVERLGGERLPLRTVQDWCAGARGIPPTVPALLALLEKAGVVGRGVGKAVRTSDALRISRASDAVTAQPQSRLKERA